METPICVTDAKTLVENIHDIKRWIYNGQLRLVVPSCTPEQVEQIYQKTKETKSAPKETRSKQFGKPAKLEYPPFDINPLLAKNFLARLKTWKDEDAASEQRKFFQEKENHGAVSLQQTSEHYTPWKDLEIEEEKPQIVEVRPTSWAEALRRKQNLANGIVENPQAPKGPVKPKLVAKAGGNEASPWKLKRDAPKLSAKDVPATLRPLMSCALWRLHESIDRNDSNELFLLSDESEIRATAQKLNITVRSTHELRVLVAAKAKRPDLSSFGDLEREFGIHTRADKERSPSNRSKGAGMHLKTEDDDLTKRVERMETSILSEKAAKINNSHTVDERNGTKLDQIVKGLSSEGRETAKNDEKRNSTEEPLRESTLSLVEDKTPGKITPRIGSPNSAYHIALSLDGANDTATRSFLGIKGEKTLEATPGASCSSLSDKATKPVGSPPKDFATSTAAPPVSSATVPLPTPIVQPEHESEDSDEDVVVFVPQPKRSSLQKKPTQQSSRPSTPVTQPQQQKPVTQSPKLSPPTTQDQAKLPGRGKTPLVISHSHSKPIVTTMIIDPDSFGRSYAVNPNSSPRTLQNSRSHHRPQSSIENALFPHGPRGPTRQSSFRISPSRQSRTNSARTSPAPQPQYETVRPRSSHAERTSSQKRSQALETKATGPAGRGSNHANSGTQLPVQRKTLNVRMVESEEFVPRIASTEARLDPIGTPQVIGVTKKVQDLVTKIADPKIQVKPKAPEPPSDHPDDLVSRSPTDAPQVERETPKPSAFESNEFVPRKVMPASQYNRRMPEADTIEPRASMPDVQYVLKSGSTRAATRGRGRLWIPS